MTKYFTKDGDTYVPVDDPLHTQAEVDSVIDKRLERERKKFADYDSLKEAASNVNTIKQDYEDKLKEKDTKIGELSSEVKSATLQTDKVKIMHEFKLSDDLEEFLVGETPEEIRARAEKLSKGIPGEQVNVNKNKKPEDEPSGSKVIAGKLFGSKSDD